MGIEIYFVLDYSFIAKLYCLNWEFQCVFSGAIGDFQSDQAVQADQWHIGGEEKVFVKPHLPWQLQVEQEVQQQSVQLFPCHGHLVPIKLINCYTGRWNVELII